MGHGPSPAVLLLLATLRMSGGEAHGARRLGWGVGLELFPAPPYFVVVCPFLSSFLSSFPSFSFFSSLRLVALSATGRGQVSQVDYKRTPSPRGMEGGGGGAQEAGRLTAKHEEIHTP